MIKLNYKNCASKQCYYLIQSRYTNQNKIVINSWHATDQESIFDWVTVCGSPYAKSKLNKIMPKVCIHIYVNSIWHRSQNISSEQVKTDPHQRWPLWFSLDKEHFFIILYSRAGDLAQWQANRACQARWGRSSINVTLSDPGAAPRRARQRASLVFPNYWMFDTH